MEKLSLSRFRKKFDFTINKASIFESIARLNSKRFPLDFDVYLPSKDKNLQRDFVWSDHQKSELILSVLKGVKLASISVILSEKENKERVYKVIDGKQRLSTLISFYRNEFFVVIDDCAYSYEDLDEEAQREIWNLGLVADIGYEYHDDMISDDDKIALFEMINFAGTPQDIEHLRNLKK